MDKYMNDYKAAVRSITAEKDITSTAKKRISERSRSYCIKHIAAAACAVLLMGGTTAYAAHIGWLDGLFGSTSSVISDNRSDFAVKTSEFKSERSDANFPYDISFGDMICDGTILYGEMHISSKSGERITENELTMETDAIINGDKNTSRQTAVIFLSENEDGSANAAFSVRSEPEIRKGDSVKMTFFENSVSADDSDIAEFSFNILDMPQTQSKHIDVDCPSVLTTYAGEKAEMQLTDIEISPLCILVKGGCGSYDSFIKITDSPDFRIDLSDGSSFYVDKRQWKLDVGSSGKSSLNSSDKVCETSGFSCSKTGSGNGYEITYNAQFRFVIPVDDVSSVTIGDVTIPVK